MIGFEFSTHRGTTSSTSKVGESVGLTVGLGVSPIQTSPSIQGMTNSYEQCPISLPLGALHSSGLIDEMKLIPVEWI
jgi:hypothetical protein